MVNSKRKGSRGERETVALFRRYGFQARRRQQYSATEGTDDIYVKELDEQFYIENKFTERSYVYPWIEKASHEAGARYPLVVYRKKKADPVAIMWANDLCRVLRKLSDYECLEDKKESDED